MEKKYKKNRIKVFRKNNNKLSKDPESFLNKTYNLSEDSFYYKKYIVETIKDNINLIKDLKQKKYPKCYMHEQDYLLKEFYDIVKESFGKLINKYKDKSINKLVNFNDNKYFEKYSKYYNFLKYFIIQINMKK